MKFFLTLFTTIVMILTMTVPVEAKPHHNGHHPHGHAYGWWKNHEDDFFNTFYARALLQRPNHHGHHKGHHKKSGTPQGARVQRKGTHHKHNSRKHHNHHTKSRVKVTDPIKNNPQKIVRCVIDRNEQDPLVVDNCVIVEVIKKTDVLHHTKTVTDRVVYGAGVIALAAVAAALVTLFAGYVLGWRKRGVKESEYMKSLLRRKP